MHTRSITFLNECGDVTISWSEDRDEVMKELIQKKIDQGYTFFVIKPIAKVIKWPKVIKNANQIKDYKVSLSDEDAERLFKMGDIGFAKNVQSNYETVRKAKNAKDAASKNTVAVRPMRGG